MSSLSDANTIASINNASIQINRYFGIFIFVFGCMGNILNILVLRQGRLRSNPCAWLFLVSSIASLVFYSTGLTTRILSGWNLDFTSYNQVFCKIRGFFVFVSPTITLWLIVLATIDRWLSSSMLTHRRAKSTLKNAQRCTILVVLVSVGLYIQTFICYEANVINAPLACYSKSLECRFIADISFALISILCPLFLMVLFGLLTVDNIRQSYQQVSQTNTIELVSSTNRNPLSKRKKIDRQLIVMLFFQVTLLTILSLPIVIQRLYSTVTLNNSKTALQNTIDNFCFSLVLLLIYIALGLPFYIYTLSGVRVFRKALSKVLQNFCRVILHK